MTHQNEVGSADTKPGMCGWGTGLWLSSTTRLLSPPTFLSWSESNLMDHPAAGVLGAEKRCNRNPLRGCFSVVDLTESTVAWEKALWARLWGIILIILIEMGTSHYWESESFLSLSPGLNEKRERGLGPSIPSFLCSLAMNWIKSAVLGSCLCDFPTVMDLWAKINHFPFNLLPSIYFLKATRN